MTHEEIHEHGIEALISALGLAGTIQFLEMQSRCKNKNRARHLKVEN